MLKDKPLPIGIDNFKELITRGYYYVDKTLLIKDLLDLKGKVNLFTRPRRFGKTLNMSMLQHFFEKPEKVNFATGEKESIPGREETCDNLFDGLNISNAGESYTKHMGQYPVINLTLKSGKQRDFALSYGCLKREIANEFKRHSYILEDKALTTQYEDYYALMMRKADDTEYATAIRFLSECLYTYYKKPVIILIDEYDVSLESAYFGGFYQDMVGFMRSVLESALKTNPYLEFAVLTGCLRIAKESIFTGLNNLKIFSVLSRNYSEYFGFTESEVDQMLVYYGMMDKKPVVKDWYNGYLFGDTEIYNPWSIIQYVYDIHFGREEIAKSYWSTTSSNQIVRDLLDYVADPVTKRDLETLMQGGYIEKKAYEDVTYGELKDTPDHLWNFLFFTGYLKKEGEYVNKSGRLFLKLTIPNKEIKLIFEDKIFVWFQNAINQENREILFQAILSLDAETVQEELNRLLMVSVSYFDHKEEFYHGFLLGCLSGMKHFITKSNRESGDGRSDILLWHEDYRKEAIILELKFTDELNELESKCEEALAQIEKKQYDAEFKAEGYKTILKYGIAFYKKSCLVKTI
ncbi:hypothetical protein FACS18947_6750 [Bacteroidia bacterium]|nr:hypothetical protein FACS18947_6750 [Bacteroidia bacterium]